MYSTTISQPNLHKHEKEKSYKDTKLNKRLPFPSIFDKPSKSLSLVVPAYNETERSMCYSIDARQCRVLTLETSVTCDSMTHNPIETNYLVFKISLLYCLLVILVIASHTDGVHSSSL